MDDVAHAPADLGARARSGTMQNVHELSQPTWMVTHARVARRRGGAGQRRRVRLVLLEDLDHRALEASPLEQRRRVGQVVGAEHDVDVARPLDDELAVLLGQAPAHRDLQVGTLLLQRLQAAEVAVELVVGVLTDAARVEHDDVGRLDVVGGLHALGREQPGDALGVVLVHLTAERAHVEAARRRLFRMERLGHDRSVYGSVTGRGTLANGGDHRAGAGKESRPVSRTSRWWISSRPALPSRDRCRRRARRRRPRRCRPLGGSSR